MDREVIIELEALNEAVRYLSNRPYKEVVGLIDSLKASIREIPNDSKKAPKPPKASNRSKPSGTGNSQ